MNKSIQRIRLPKELLQINENHYQHGITCTIADGTPGDHIFLEAKLPGPKSSPYEGGIFVILISVSEQYPFRPANFRFVTPIFHPNIDKSGLICLDLLRMPPTGTYNPAITLETILLSIQLLMANPNPDDPLNGEAAIAYKENIEQFNQTAKKFVATHCIKASNGDKNEDNNATITSTTLNQ